MIPSENSSRFTQTPKFQIVTLTCHLIDCLFMRFTMLGLNTISLLSTKYLQMKNTE